MGIDTTRKMVELSVEMINDAESIVGQGNLVSKFSLASKYVMRLVDILSSVKDLKAEFADLDANEIVTLVKEVAKVDLPGDKADHIKGLAIDSGVHFATALGLLGDVNQVVADAKAKA